MIATTYLSEGWEFLETRHDHKYAQIGYSVPEWLSAVVPGHIHLDLMEHGIIPDPHERMNEIGVQWIDQTDWSYRCKFDWSPDADAPNRVLRFEGLDTVCTIWLNGEQIGASDNMFLPLEIDVSKKLVDGENELRINFESAIRVGLERQAEFFKSEGLPAAVERFEERSFVRKIQCMYGWDWGPRLVSCGIWRPVSLLEFANRVAELTAKQEWQADGSVIVKLHAEFEGKGTLSYSFGEESSNTGEFHIVEPELWWPIGCGEQNLYEISASISSNKDFADHVLTKQIGLRQIKLLREKDEIGESFEFEVNGHKVYAKGFNWIPDMSFPSALTLDRYEERILQAVDLGSNMLRIWGGGMYESEDFYDLCDELGVMVWQDFPHACAYYPDTAEWQEKVRPEAEYHVKRLSSRASLALWCGNNENLQMWQQKWQWMGHEHPPRFYGSNFYDQLLPSIVTQFDGQTAYIPTSPCGESEPDANGGKIGDSHYWDAWHGRGDWKYYLDSEARFSSEYGFASSCSLALWEETLADEDWGYRSPAVRWHDKTRKGYDTFVGYVKLHYPDPETLEDWVYYSQLNQRDALRMGVEHFRRNAFCRGSLIWQLNDIWPTQSWAVIDSSGRYKAAAYELQRLYGTTVLSLERVKDKVRLHYVDDRVFGEELRMMEYVHATHLTTGEELKEWEFKFTTSPGQRQIIGEIDLTGLSVPDTLIHTWLTEAWHLLDEPKNTRFASPARILGSSHAGFSIQIDHPVVDLMLSVDGDTAPFLDNFLTFGRPGVYPIAVSEPITSFEARSLAGDHATRMTRSPLE